MIEFLRLLGMLNAAIWLGAAVFYVFAAGSMVHSEELGALLGKNSTYFAEAIGQLLSARFFMLQLVCGLLALFHLGAEWLYLGKVPRKLWLGLIVFLLAAGLFSGIAVHSRLQRLNIASHAVNLRPEQREIAAKSFRAWQQTSTAVSLVVVGCLAVYFWRVSSPPTTGRFVNAVKLRS